MEGTYEYECMRSELLGIEKPDQDQFEKARTDRLRREQEDREANEAAMLQDQEEALKATGGKIDELNTILSSTQQKLNRFKQTACGSLSNIFGRNSVDIPDPGAANAGSGSATASSSRRNTTACGEILGQAQRERIDINAALDNLDELQHNEQEPEGAEKNTGGMQPIPIPTAMIRNAKLDIEKKMTSQFDKLDSLLNKAEKADISMAEQTKQMKKMAK